MSDVAANLTSPTKSAGAEGKARSSGADVLDFLDSLDNYSNAPAPPAAMAAATPATADGTQLPAPATSAATPGKADPYNVEDAQSVLDFLDEITQRSSTPTPAIKRSALTNSASLANVPGGGLSRSGSRTNILSAVAASRKSGESIRSARTTSSNSPASTPLPLPETPGLESTTAPPASVDGGWGWGSVWNTASTIVQQARTVAEEQVKTATATASGVGGLGGLGEGLMKALGENEQAKKWGEGVREFARTNQLDQLGKDLRSQTLKSLTELLNAVAPPIAEHEVIKVNLSHDMIGYDGVETLVYRGLAKIMEQIEGGTLVVNKGDEEKPKGDAEISPDGEERKLNYVEGLAEGWKLAGANLDQLIKNSFVPTSKLDAEAASNSSTDGLTVPVTTCPIYMRIQPCLAPLPFFPSDAPSTATPGSSTTDSTMALFFLLLLRDPTHNLVHSSLSQSMPAAWLDIPFEENEWVEDVMVDVIRRGVEVIGQEYISHRTRAQSVAISKARGAAQETLTQHSAPVEGEQVDEEQERASAEAVAASRVV